MKHCLTLLQPSTTTEIEAIFLKLSKEVHIPDAKQGVWKSILLNLYEMMAIFPPDILESTAIKWKENNKFFPLTAFELLEIAQPMLTEREKTYKKLIALKLVADNPSPDEGWVTREWWRKISSKANDIFDSHMEKIR